MLQVFRDDLAHMERCALVYTILCCLYVRVECPKIQVFTRISGTYLHGYSGKNIPANLFVYELNS